VAQVLVDGVCSPFSPVSNRHNERRAAEATEAKLKAKIGEQEDEIEKLLQRCRNDHKLIVEKERENDRLTQRYMADLTRIAEHEKDVQRFVQESAEQKARVGHYKERLRSATNALSGLQEVHAAEVKAVKHEAHVKDLMRVAKEREAAIEKDKLSIQINYIKEVQSIIAFSLNTAEQALNDVQPQMVDKLVQGRTKRLKLLEQSTQVRMRDLDQRSADTCAVNTAHLNGFQRKAADNNIAAKEMTHAATRKLLSILNETVSTSGAGMNMIAATGTGSLAGNSNSRSNNSDKSSIGAGTGTGSRSSKPTSTGTGIGLHLPSAVAAAAAAGSSTGAGTSIQDRGHIRTLISPVLSKTKL